MDTFWSIVDPAVGSLDDGDLESRWCRLDGTWIGLLYVLMGIGVHQMSEADALACGLSDGAYFHKRDSSNSRPIYPPFRLHTGCDVVT